MKSADDFEVYPRNGILVTIGGVSVKFTRCPQCLCLIDIEPAAGAHAIGPVEQQWENHMLKMHGVQIYTAEDMIAQIRKDDDGKDHGQED